jgi:hypothetical protein
MNALPQILLFMMKTLKSTPLHFFPKYITLFLNTLLFTMVIMLYNRSPELSPLKFESFCLFVLAG